MAYASCEPPLGKTMYRWDGMGKSGRVGWCWGPRQNSFMFLNGKLFLWVKSFWTCVGELIWQQFHEYNSCYLLSAHRVPSVIVLSAFMWVSCLNDSSIVIFQTKKLSSGYLPIVLQLISCRECALVATLLGDGFGHCVFRCWFPCPDIWLQSRHWWSIISSLYVM